MIDMTPYTKGKKAMRSKKVKDYPSQGRRTVMVSQHEKAAQWLLNKNAILRALHSGCSNCVIAVQRLYDYLKRL